VAGVVALVAEKRRRRKPVQGREAGIPLADSCRMASRDEAWGLMLIIGEAVDAMVLFRALQRDGLHRGDPSE
jgi:hypothetical protein